MSTTATAPAPEAGLKHPGLVSLINACDIHLPSGQKLALIAIARCRNTHTGRSAISFKTIGRRSGFGERQASRHVEALMGLGLVSRVGKIGQCYVYAINTQALAQADTRHGPAVDNSGGTPDTGDTDTRHFEQPPLTPMTATPDMDVRCSGVYSGFYSEGESEASAPAAVQVEAAFPPLPIFEDPKTEQPAPVITEPTELIELAGPVLDAATLAALDAARADFGMAPLTPHDRELLADSAAAVGVTPNTVAGWQLGELRAADPLVDAATLAAVNVQRAANGKREPIHLADLVQQARLAGITPHAAAQHILAKPSRSFFLARYYRPEPTATPTGPVELTEAGKRAQAQIARALAPSAVSLVASPSARPIGAAVAPRHRAPVSVGASTGTGWASTAVERFTAGQPVSHATITSAASALGLSLANLKAQRAATQTAAA
ncbi:hypothetical protein [Malikia sp.]|uniref:hypothetical protein n=1 Tax=Malikia sp. TaxID=2070706 RepID=UPI00262D84A7|nr:hypothetical protein [Malikia sp.]MDD2729301.1 hypothetical protein [Malikia sp.]